MNKQRIKEALDKAVMALKQVNLKHGGESKDFSALHMGFYAGLMACGYSPEQANFLR